MEVQIKKEKTTTRAGQYIFINCPEISYFQWHPFTLTRCVVCVFAGIKLIFENKCSGRGLHLRPHPC
jgi:predicted ferric reductase